MKKDYKTLPNFRTKEVFLGDPGLLTISIFDKCFNIGKKLTTLHFMEDEKIIDYLNDYFDEAANHALNVCGKGFLFEPLMTWKASKEICVEDCGMSENKWKELLRKVIDFGVKIKTKFQDQAKDQGRECQPILIAPMIGPREGGYSLTIKMTPEEAEEYHMPLIKFLAEQPEVDYLSALTFADPNEVIGMANAAKKCGVGLSASFTVEKHNIRTPSGHSLKEAIEMVDKETDNYPMFYGVNCSHPSWIIDVYRSGLNDPWTERLRYIKGNGSIKSHEELDECGTLDNGDPAEYGRLIKEFYEMSQGNINNVAGCCGTDMRHIYEATKALGFSK